MSLVQCRDEEGWRWTSRLREFDLALCAEEGLILASFLIVFIIVALTRMALLSRAPAHDISRNSRWRLWTKLTLLGLAFAASLTTLCFVLTGQFSATVRLPYILELLALLLALWLTRLNHLRTRSSSTILLLFWPCYTIALAIWTRSHVQEFSVTPLVPLKWTIVSLGLLSFAVECISPDDTLHSGSESPILTANIFSIWSFTWMTPLLRKGSRVVIVEDDLPTLVPHDESTEVGNDLECALKEHSGLWTALFVAYGRPYLAAGLLKLIQDILVFAQPFLLRALLSYISEYQDRKGAGILSNSPPLFGYSIAVVMFVSSMIQAVLLHQHFQICIQTGMHIRAGLITAIYKKALVLSSDERGRSTGDIVNLMSVDATRLQDLCEYGLFIISGPFQVALAFAALYNLLGWSASVGVTIMVLSVPLNTFIVRTMGKMHEELMKNRDKRTALMSEILSNIKSIKLYAWEYAFIRRVFHVRNNLELKALRKIGMAIAMNMALWVAIPLVVSFGSFATASVFSTRPLTSDIVFPAISLFMLLQFPLGMFSHVTSSIAEALVSVRRLSDFLRAEELQEDAVKRIERRTLAIDNEVLSIRDGEFKWSKHAIQPTLEGINLTVKKGELVGILGRIGDGKSSLLSAIIGDMWKAEGEVVLTGTVAYAAQNPWILTATVRDNILFSHTYDESFYNLVIEACALKPDLAILSQGDMTVVGEKGVTLSGGQRARIALARAVYARADLVLLDDVLAAVDAHVARHIFDNVIGPDGLLATKARVLVTNSIAYLKSFNQLAYIRRGIILECGSYPRLVSDPNSAVRKLVQDHAINDSSSGTTSGTESPTNVDGNSASMPTSDSNTHRTLVDELGSVVEKSVRRTSFNKAVIAPPPSTREETSSGMSKEHSEQGRVKKEVYFQYLQAVPKAGFYLFVLVNVFAHTASVTSTVMVRLWGERNRESGENAGLIDPYLIGYGLLNLIYILSVVWAGLLVWVVCSLRSSKYLHDSMLESVMRAPLSFFETTPTGRILNLFTRDLYAVDLILGRVVQTVTSTGISTVATLLIIAFSFPPFILTAIPLSWFYYRMAVYYLSSSRELKRLEAVSRPPIFTWFSESLSGLSTIRAYNQQTIFTAANARRIDRNLICYFPSATINRWLGIRIEFIGSVVILFTAIFAVAAVVTSNVDAGLVGMVLSYALSLTGALNWLLRSASDGEQNIISVERITHYVNHLPPEAPFELPDSKPPVGWPGAGEVEFREYSLRYRPDLDLVLKKISLTIKPAEKIGIVGRTGAGKSSLLLALFRILEAASGKIFIDGVDISTIGLHDLRSVVSIVPQSPDLFEGTIRENIDPVGEYQDVDIWVALEHAHLKPYVESLPEGLDTYVQEGGLSLSAGQRQLLCFARALLRKSKVLVLDEATSAVDLDTDQAIQEIIRGSMFDKVTTLTIAHRLNTIMESTRVLVLDQGRVAELDTPEVLLADKSSRFYSMALEAGLVQDAEVRQSQKADEEGKKKGNTESGSGQVQRREE